MSDRDRQAPPPRDGESAFLGGPAPDGIPMTGEEDPLAEVDDPDFAPVVGEFVASERDLLSGANDAADKRPGAAATGDG